MTREECTTIVERHITFLEHPSEEVRTRFRQPAEQVAEAMKWFIHYFADGVKPEAEGEWGPGTPTRWDERHGVTHIADATGTKSIRVESLEAAEILGKNCRALGLGIPSDMHRLTGIEPPDDVEEAELLATMGKPIKFDLDQMPMAYNEYKEPPMPDTRNGPGGIVFNTNGIPVAVIDSLGKARQRSDGPVLTADEFDRLVNDLGPAMEATPDSSVPNRWNFGPKVEDDSPNIISE